MPNMIAEVKRVEQTLRHLTMIAEQAREGVAVVDLNGTLRFVNTAWARMHGYETRNELMGKPVGVFHTKEQMETDVIGFIEETKHRGWLEGPIGHMQRDGATFPTQTKMTTVKNEQGKAIGFIAFATDLSASRQADELLRQQRAELKAANEQLQSRITEHEWLENKLQQCRNELERQTAELMEANEELQRQLAERARAQNELQEYCDGVEQQTSELAGAINKVVQFAVSGPQVPCQKS